MKNVIYNECDYVSAQSAEEIFQEFPSDYITYILKIRIF